MRSARKTIPSAHVRGAEGMSAALASGEALSYFSAKLVVELQRLRASVDALPASVGLSLGDTSQRIEDSEKLLRNALERLDCAMLHLHKEI